MRLNRQQIKALSADILDEAIRLGLVRLSAAPENVAAALEKAIADDLAVEDRLNDEVREILGEYKREIEQGRVDYKTMFEMVKKKLVKERGIIL